MLNEFIRRIEKAKRTKQLVKIEQEFRKEYGIWSQTYGKLIDLCIAKFKEIKGEIK